MYFCFLYNKYINKKGFKMGFNKRLNEVIQGSGFTNLLLSETLESRYGIKISKESIAKYRNGSRTPSPDFVEAIIDLLNADASYLMGGNKKNVKQVPIIGTASCGGTEINYMQDENMKANYNGDYWSKDLYCVVANGDSMATDIEDGDECICDPNAPIKNGDFVHYQINGESAIKLYNKDEDNYIIEFIPFNPTPDFKTRIIRLESDEIEHLEMAKVVSINKIQLNNRIARLKRVGR